MLGAVPAPDAKRLSRRGSEIHAYQNWGYDGQRCRSIDKIARWSYVAPLVIRTERAEKDGKGGRSGGGSGRRYLRTFPSSPTLPSSPSFYVLSMRIVLQRVSRASVTIVGVLTGTIQRGFCVLVGFTSTDTPEVAEWMAEKIVGLRLFSDAEGKMNLGLSDVGGSVLVVSQFTLYGDAGKGRRPSFIDAARPEIAIPLYEYFIAKLRARGVTVATGEFGADMQVEIHNDGPVTLLLERNA